MTFHGAVSVQEQHVHGTVKPRLERRADSELGYAVAIEIGHCSERASKALRAGVESADARIDGLEVGDNAVRIELQDKNAAVDAGVSGSTGGRPVLTRRYRKLHHAAGCVRGRQYRESGAELRAARERGGEIVESAGDSRQARHAASSA